jgi:outer membrane receptor protein involved in Fe transport
MMLASFAFGQGIVTGSISGTVQDTNKAVIPNASVKAVNTATNATFVTQTDAQGYFSLKSLPIGTYTLTIEATKFAKLQLAGIDVDSGRNIGLPSQTLQVGSASEVVNVEGSTPLVETTTAQIGGNFDTKAVAQLPNTGGGFDNLVLYVPGIGDTGSTNFSNRNGAGFGSNGLRGRSNNFQIDGQANNDNSVAGPSVFLSNPDVLSELQVVSNNFSAEYGRNTGTVVNYVLKSGTNTFHGSGFEFYTGNEFYSHANQEKNPVQGFCPPGVAAGNQTPFSTKCTAPVVPRDVNNRWGGTFGGPIIKNKAWFFASYQNTRERGSLTGTSTGVTPTPAGLAQLQAEFPGNPAVAALVAQGPYAATIGNPHPTGNILTGATTQHQFDVTDGVRTASDIEFAQIQRSVPNPFDDTQVTGRGDWQISDKDRFFARYIWQHNVFGAGSGTISSGAYVAVPAKDQQIGLDYSRTWTNHFVQQLRFSYARAAVVFAGGGGYPDCTIGNVTACPTNISFVNDTTNNFVTSGLATNLPQDRLVNNTQWQGNNDWDHGRHSIKFGAEYDRQRSPNHFLPTINGGFTFGSTGTFVANPTPTKPNTYVSAFSHFLEGNTSTLALADGTFNFNFKEQDVSYYARDSWRVRDNFTLDYGIRWEWDQQAINMLRDITLRNVANGFWSPSAPASVTTLPEIPQDLNNWGPSVGFAYTPHFWTRLFGQDKTVIRGGYRIAYDPAFYNIFLNVATSAPVVNLGSISNAGVPAAGTGEAVQSAFFGSIPRGANPGFRAQTRVSNDFHNPYTQQWSFGIERQVSSKIAFETRYAGNHTVGNFQTINGNPQIGTLPASVVPAGIAPCSTPGAPGNNNNTGLGRENCDFGDLRVRTNGAFSIYHGLQNELKIRDFHHFTANVAYTWSKAIDNVSEIFVSNGGVSTPIAQNPFDPTDAERGVAAQSFPHVVSLYWVYDFPWRSSQQGFVGKLAGGWQWSGTFRYQTGAPITPFQSVANAACDTSFNTVFIGADSCRPILANPGAPFDQVGRFTNPTTLINVSTGQPTTPNDVHFIVNNAAADAALCGGDPFACTVSRNIYRSMPRDQLDLTMKKSFKVSERVTTELRADLFNALNYMYTGTPGLNVNNRSLSGVLNNKPAPGSFGNGAFNSSTTPTAGRRFLQLGAHVTF